MTKFRVFYTDGATLDVDAETPAQARTIAIKRQDGLISKIKVVRERADA